jgi:hypothetical protein
VCVYVYVNVCLYMYERIRTNMHEEAISASQVRHAHT